MTPSDTLDRGRIAFAEHRWGEAFDALADADESGALHAADLERMSTAAILLGRDAVGMDLATRAHEAFLGIEDAAGAARRGLVRAFRGVVRGRRGASPPG